jgi:hypothetical protein
MDTLFLNPDTWDLDIDANGNIALATSAYAVAQDVASAGLLWKAEAPFDTDRGIPYDTAVLGYAPARQQLAGWYDTEAETVPDVSAASTVLQYAGRGVTGQIQITLTDGSTLVLDL